MNGLMLDELVDESIDGLMILTDGFMDELMMSGL